MTETTIEHGTDIETVLDEALDFEIACEYSSHMTSPDLPAAWLAWFPPSECGCDDLLAMYLCSVCKSWRCDVAQLVYCATGEHLGPIRVLRLERIKP